MIAEIEDWLIDTTRTELECYFGAGSVDVDSGPGEWDFSYLKSIGLISDLPAVRVVVEGAAARDTTALYLDVGAAIYIVKGWSSQDQRARRRGTQGIYRVTEILAPRLHNVTIPDVGQCRVDTIENRWTGALDRIGVALYAISLDINGGMDYVQPPAKPLDDFLRAHIDYDIPDGEDVDATDDVTLPGP